MSRGKLFSSRKFKYGAAATVFTALFIVAVILLNVIVSAIDSKYSLYLDLTNDQIFSISESTETMVNEQFSLYREREGEDPKIMISFLQARDKIVENEQKSWVVTLAESYAEKYSQIQVEFREDLNIHPENYAYYTDLGYDINSNVILVTNTLEKGSFRYLTFDSCLVYNEGGDEVWAFQGEMKFNAALYYITAQKSPIVTFTTGHGESVPQSLTEILTNCGFTIETVDLTKDSIDPNSKILFMCSPQKDILTAENDSVESEYTKISDYLNSYRSMVVIGSPTTPVLPVLDELLADWGMELVRNQVIMDDVYCHTQNNKMLYVNYNESDKVAAALTGSLTKLSNPPKSISIDSAPIRILKTGDGNTTGVEAVLSSTENSYVEAVTEEGVQKQSGSYNLMAISSRFTYIDNTETYGHLLLIGSENFTETNAFREQFGNTDIVYNMIRLLSDEEVSMDVHYKVIEDYAIDMEKGAVYTYGVITVAVIPVIIASFGLVVYIKRKHM